MAENLILAENTLTTQFLDVYGVYGFTIPFGGDFSEFPLTLGDECVVIWDGAEYKVTVGDSSAIIADTMFVGNGSAFGLPGNNEPFVIAWDGTGATIIALTDTSETSHTVEIYQVVSNDIVLKDHAGNDLDAIEGAVEIRIPTTDGGFQHFVSGTRVQTTIDLDFSNGDVVVTPSKGQVFNEVTIKKPEGLVSENIPKGITIAGVPGGLASGGNLDAYLNGSLVEISSEVQHLVDYALYKRSNVVSVDFPLLETAGESAIHTLNLITTFSGKLLKSVGAGFLVGCSSLVTCEFPVLETAGGTFLASCSSLVTCEFPVLETIGAYSFMSCTGLTKVDFGKLSALPNYAFYYDENLTAVILRSPTMVTLSQHATNTGGGVFGSNCAKNAYVYVPSSLLSTYKSTSYWNVMSARLRAIEDYPDICG